MHLPAEQWIRVLGTLLAMIGDLKAIRDCYTHAIGFIRWVVAKHNREEMSFDFGV